ncbi:helix-turn-helix domain-containing protein [Goodfellowiella coeruleoviolacea]|uniref:Helix-turn-helix domain-containing protein n=1 Tax=Goodfellowiella coeruleoviolacea TaxID=334858 RepID=A0AAE3GKE0_9PSEU|nr:helix-turn-helix transcriptional regulator [Goodfellowiella coeruleoviolacea]MCP2169218.1 Helix-turn-helix domain-containing protein [Goodfellowiella coeruleoviolacea]
MARRAGRSVRSRRLAYLLRKLRNEIGVSGDTVGAAVGMSGSKINRIENAEIGVYRDDLEKLLDYYRASAGQRAELLAIAAQADERGWSRFTSHHLPRDWRIWLDFEEEASSLRDYQPLMIPGLLQTAEYAKAIIRGTGRGLSDSAVDALVASRMARQNLLSRTVPLTLHAIIEETALTRPFGQPGALGRQLRHLADAASRPNITLRVLPTSAGPHPGLTGSFVILGYHDDEASLVLLENRVASVFLDSADQVESYTAAWQELSELAHDPERSVELISRTAALLPD